MIIAVPNSPAIHSRPNWNTSRHYRELYFKSGFITYPMFLDNWFIAEGGPQLAKLEEHLIAFGYFGLVQIGILPDRMPEEALKIQAKWPNVNWVWPLHSRDEDTSSFKWVGYPHAKSRRDYTITEFLRLTEGKKRWYLGLWDSINPVLLRHFDGMDTLIPNKYALIYHKKWLGWRSNETAHSSMGPSELLAFNVSSFKDWVLKNIYTLETQSKLSKENGCG